jgi:hypothetical protein
VNSDSLALGIRDWTHCAQDRQTWRIHWRYLQQHNNYWNTKSINQNKKFLKKTVFRTLKVERSQKYARAEFAGPTQNPKKNIGIPNQPIKPKIFPKKYV